MNYPIVILGDLNCNMLNTNNDYRILKGIRDELNLNQIIKSPTRVTATTKSLIDIVLVSDITFIKRSGVIKTLISDHYPVFVTLKLNKENNHPKLSPQEVFGITIQTYLKQKYRSTQQSYRRSCIHHPVSTTS